MNPGDLVKVAQSFSGNWGSIRTPVFDGSATLGLLLEIYKFGESALVLIDGHPTWVVLRNLEAVNEAR